MNRMLQLSVESRLNPTKILEMADKYFIEELSLEPINRAAHFHGKEGSLQVGISGRKLIGKEEFSPKTTLDEFVKYIEEHYDLKLENYYLHLHSTLGHINISITNEKPSNTTLESIEFDYQIKEFAKMISK